MTPHQPAVSARFLDSACARREPVVVALDEALAHAVLPPHAPNVDEVGAWLVDTRLQRAGR